MNIRKGFLLLLAALCLTVFAAAEEFDGYVVKLHPQDDTMAALSISEQNLLEPVENLPQTYLVESAEDVEKLRATGLVEYAEPNYILEPLVAPNDPYYAEQWTLPAIDWSFGTAYDGSGVTVAVIDSGLDISHEDFRNAKISPYSKNFLGNGTHPEDYFRDQRGHGTFVASQIAPVTNNALGISAVAPGTELMILRCLSQSGSDKFPYNSTYDEGSGSATRVAEAMRYAADNGADVINISLGIRSASQTLQEAVDYAHEKGVVVVAAAGNDGNSTPFYPASGEHVISVGSVSRSGSTLTKSWFSQYNAYIDVTAPGGDVMGVDIYPFSTTEWYTDVADTYRTDGGTSYSSPVTAALVGICKQVDEKLDAEDIQSLLAATSVDYGAAGYDTSFGYGVVNYKNLVTALTETEYAIEYVLGAADAALPQDATVTYGLNRTADLVLPTPIREGYTFLGWYESETLEGQTVSVLPKGSLGTAEAVLENGTVTGYAIGPVTYYAKWAPDSTVTPTALTYDRYTPGSLQLTLSLNGNAFAGISCNGQALPADAYTLSENTLTLLDAWLSTLPLGQTELTLQFSGGKDAAVTLTVTDTAPVYSVQFYLRPTDGAAYEAKSVRGTTMGTLPQEPARAGYRFTGWYLADGTTRVTAKTALTGDTAVYAAWAVSGTAETPAITARTEGLELVFNVEEALEAAAVSVNGMPQEAWTGAVDIAAKNMGDAVTVELLGSTGQVLAAWQGTYAQVARQDINDALAAGDTARAAAVTAALDLGAAAMTHFANDADVPNWGMDVARQTLDTHEGGLSDLLSDTSTCTDNAVILGTSLLLEDGLKMKIYFAQGVTPVVNGMTFSGSVAELAVTELSAAVQIAALQGETVVATGTDSAAGYLARLRAAGNTALAEAIALYGMTNLG